MGQILTTPPSTRDVATSTLDLFAPYDPDDDPNPNTVFRRRHLYVPRQLPSAARFQALPGELQNQVGEFAPSYIFPVDIDKLKALGNCGKFLKNMEPITAEQMDANPELRVAFYEVVKRSLAQFHERVKQFQLYKYATIQNPLKHHRDFYFNRMPLCERVYLAHVYVETHPDMSTVELMEHCKRIADWKNELRRMPDLFQHVLELYQRFVANPTQENLPPEDVWGPIELFHLDDYTYWGDEGWYIWQYGLDFPDDLQQILDECNYMIDVITSRKPHDDAMLSEMLKPLE